MRPIYFILKFALKIPLWIYYPRVRTVNKPKKRFARTIFACNHAAAFMDPLVIASHQPPIVFFMTRSDVFKPFLNPFFWATHMLPIYRSIDGEDTKSKNESIFKICYNILNRGQSLIIFSEGFTDDKFIRRLKPIKKGAVRIGFGALEATNWKKNIYVQAVGVNYADPNVIGSDVVISNSEPICLNDFKETYFNNPNKTINDLTKVVEKEMQNQLTDVRESSWAVVHEHIMRMTRKGMNAVDSDKSIPLLKRWNYSKNLAKWLNEQNLKNHPQMESLRESLSSYFNRLKTEEIEEIHLYKFIHGKWSKTLDWMYFISIAPFLFIGIIHNYIPYHYVKKFVQKAFKRKVFWGSVKMMLGTFFSGIYNALIVCMLHIFVYENIYFWIIYYFAVPTLSGVIALNFKKRWNTHLAMKKLSVKNISSLIEQRKKLIHQIKEIIPVA